jgi:hypothetical protein
MAKTRQVGLSNNTTATIQELSVGELVDLLGFFGEGDNTKLLEEQPLLLIANNFDKLVGMLSESVKLAEDVTMRQLKLSDVQKLFEAFKAENANFFGLIGSINQMGATTIGQKLASEGMKKA